VTSGNFCGYLDPEGQRSYYTLHFTARFDRAFKATGTWQDDKLNPGATEASGGTGGFGTNGRPVAGKGAGGYVEFEPGADPVNVKVGISYVSRAGAEANLAAENPPRRSFDDVQDAARKAWRDRLSAVKVGGGTDDERTTFYTALYHALLHPNVISDADRRYRGADGKVHRVGTGHRAQYGTYSGWDVYRSQVQLLTLLDPRTGSDIAQSLLELARQNGGVWDRWLHGASGTHVMNGDPAPATLAGIRAFGGRDFDLRGALDSLVKAATVPTELDLSPAGKPIMSVGQRPSLDKYLAKHYMPSVSNAWGGAAETLEMSGADFALAQLATAAGEKKTAETFTRRSQWWQNNFNIAADPTGGYIANRKADGSWVTGFTPATGNGFVEGTAAQYTWMVQHNPAGLFAAMGGQSKAVERLDSFFHNADGSWAFTGSGGDKSELDNEPSINVPYLYAYAGAPHKTQETVRAAMGKLWSTQPGGIPGNDDLGAMSSWYVFSALGMYPQVPSRAELVLGSPVFPRARISRPNGNDIDIRAAGAAADSPYIQSLKVNGRTSERPWLPASFVRDGGTLDYTLAGTPNRAWGSAAEDAPPSFRDGRAAVPDRRRPDHGDGRARRQHEARHPRARAERRHGSRGALPRRDPRGRPWRPPPRARSRTGPRRSRSPRTRTPSRASTTSRSASPPATATPRTTSPSPSPSPHPARCSPRTTTPGSRTTPATTPRATTTVAAGATPARPSRPPVSPRAGRVP
jgi:predicted alpha-1,2-mannosidase